MQIINQSHRIDEAIAAVSAIQGQNMVDVLRAVKAGAVQLLLLTDRREQITNAALARLPAVPVLAMLGDDDDFSTGPDGWRCARFMGAWARAAHVHATGYKPGDYDLIIAGAVLTGRGLIVETASRFTMDWAPLFPHCGAVCSVPHPGQQHPLPEAAPLPN